MSVCNTIPFAVGLHLGHPYLRPPFQPLPLSCLLFFPHYCHLSLTQTDSMLVVSTSSPVQSSPDRVVFTTTILQLWLRNLRRYTKPKLFINCYKKVCVWVGWLFFLSTVTSLFITIQHQQWRNLRRYQTAKNYHRT